MKSVIALALVGATAAAYVPVDIMDPSLLDYQYMQYAALFNKHTHSLAEYNMRMHEFGKTQAFIAEFNKRLDTHFLGHNAYSDWTDEERHSFLSNGLAQALRDPVHM